MTKKEPVIELKDPLVLAACELRWSDGDKFALIEAVAICAARELPYPDWVRQQIDLAMTSVFEATFPGVDLRIDQPGLGGSPLPISLDEATLKKNFNEASKAAIKALGLRLNRDHAIATRKRAIRDYYLAELVAEFANFKAEPPPQFIGVTAVKRQLEEALRRSKEEWEELVTADGLLSESINERTLKIRDVPPECRMATFDMIDNAWDKYKDLIVKERQEDHELAARDEAERNEDCPSH